MYIVSNGFLGLAPESACTMGRKERREREQKRENYATKHSAQKQKQTLIALGVLAIVAVIVAYAVVIFLEQSQSGNTPGGPPDAEPLGSAHTHTAILVKIFGDKFDFSSPAYQIKSSWIHFEGSDGSTIHKHANGVTLGYLFETLAIGIDEECFAFTDRRFCNDDQYSLAYYVNGEQVEDIREYEPVEEDRILISYGAETPEALQSDLLELESQPLVK